MHTDQGQRTEIRRNNKVAAGESLLLKNRHASRTFPVSFGLLKSAVAVNKKLLETTDISSESLHLKVQLSFHPVHFPVPDMVVLEILATSE